MRLRLNLLLVACLLLPACEENPTTRLGILAFGPDETAYPFAVVHGHTSDIATLHVKGTDQDGVERFALTVGPGSTLLYRLPQAADEDAKALAKRARAYASSLNLRLRAVGLFDPRATAAAGGLLRIEIPAGSIDLGADIDPLVSGAGSIDVRSVLGPSRELGWTGTADEWRQFKKDAIATWRADERQGRPHREDKLGRRVVLDAGKDGSQPYHFHVLGGGGAAHGLDRSLFKRAEVANPDGAQPVLVLTWAEGARARLDAWQKTQGARKLALILDGQHYAKLKEGHVTDEAIRVPVRTWACRPPQAWARQLARSLIAPPLTEPARFVARVNHAHAEKGSFLVLSPMAREGSLKVEVSAPGVVDVKPVDQTRKHEHGHFSRYYFITTSYLGARHCGDLPVELATWKKYQEVPLLTFNVGITLSHHDSLPLAIMAADMLADWVDENGEPLRRIKMGLKKEAPAVRWASARCLATRARLGLVPKPDAQALLEDLLTDTDERVRVVSALGLKRLQSPTSKYAAVLEAAKQSEDAWIGYALRGDK